jgi:hypothetical protein
MEMFFINEKNYRKYNIMLSVMRLLVECDETISSTKKNLASSLFTCYPISSRAIFYSQVLLYCLRAVIIPQAIVGGVSLPLSLVRRRPSPLAVVGRRRSRDLWQVL